MSFLDWVFTRPFTLLVIMLLSFYCGMILLGIFAVRPRREQKVDPETVAMLRAQRAQRVESHHEVVGDNSLFI